MRSSRAIALLLALGAEPALAEAPQWTVDVDESRIAFSAKQMSVPVPGRFERFTATIRFDPDDLAASKVVIEIDVASVSTPNPDIEAEITKANWFDVANHPTARFETTGFERTGEGAYAAMATLSLRGVTKEVALPFRLDIGEDPEDASRLRAEAEGEVTVSRTEFGIGQGDWRKTDVVADEVVISFRLVAHRA